MAVSPSSLARLNGGMGTSKPVLKARRRLSSASSIDNNYETGAHGSIALYDPQDQMQNPYSASPWSDIITKYLNGTARSQKKYFRRRTREKGNSNSGGSSCGSGNGSKESGGGGSSARGGGGFSPYVSPDQGPYQHQQQQQHSKHRLQVMSPPPDPPPLAGNPSQPLDPRSPPPTRASLGSSGDCGPNHNNLDNNCSLSSRSPTTSLSAAPLLNLGAASTAAAAASGNTRGTASSPSTPSLVGGSPLTNNTFVPSPPISNSSPLSPAELFQPPPLNPTKIGAGLGFRSISLDSGNGANKGRFLYDQHGVAATAAASGSPPYGHAPASATLAGHFPLAPTPIRTLRSGGRHLIHLDHQQQLQQQQQQAQRHNRSCAENNKLFGYYPGNNSDFSPPSTFPSSQLAAFFVSQQLQQDTVDSSSSSNSGAGAGGRGGGNQSQHSPLLMEGNTTAGGNVAPAPYCGNVYKEAEERFDAFVRSTSTEISSPILHALGAVHEINEGNGRRETHLQQQQQQQQGLQQNIHH